MKYLLIYFILILTLGSCKKEDIPINQVYPIHIKLGYAPISPIGTINRLVITESGTGKYLGEFEIPQNVYEFTSQLTVEGNEPTAFDYHFIQPSGLDFPYIVNSQVGVTKGSFVYFNSFDKSRVLGQSISLKITGIASFDSLATGFFRPKNLVLDEVEQTLSMDIPTFFHQGIVLRLKANGSSGFRYYYLPDSLHGNTLALNWNDLALEANLRQISLQGNPYISAVEIDGVSPDNKYAISVCRSDYPATLPTFNLPDVFPANWMLRVKVYTSGFFCERLFNLQEPIIIPSPNLSIDHLEYSSNQIIVLTSGEVDNVRCGTFDGDFYWEINGSKDAFVKVALPDLSPFLPPSVKQSSITGFVAQIQQFDGYNYPEIQEGFPYVNTGFFPVARSGFYQIQKSF